MMFIVILFLVLVAAIVVLGLFGLGTSKSNFTAMGGRGKGPASPFERDFYVQETKEDQKNE